MSEDKECVLINSIGEDRFLVIKQLYDAFQNNNYNTEGSNYGSYQDDRGLVKPNKNILIKNATIVLGQILELIPERSLREDLQFVMMLVAGQKKELERKLRDSEKMRNEQRRELEKLKAENAIFKQREYLRKIDEEAQSIIKELEDPETALKAKNLNELRSFFSNNEMGLNEEANKKIFTSLGYAPHYYEFIFTYFNCPADIFKAVNYNIDITEYKVSSDNLPHIKSILRDKIKSESLKTFINNLPIDSEELRQEVLIFVNELIKFIITKSNIMPQEIKTSAANIIQKMADDYVVKKSKSEETKEPKLKIKHSDKRASRVRRTLGSGK